MPASNRKQKWKPLAIEFDREEDETTAGKNNTDDGTAANSSQRPQLAEAEDGAKAESGTSGNASSKEPASKQNLSSWESEASSTSQAGAHDGEGKISKEPYDSIDDDVGDNIGAEYDVGEIETNHTMRASGRVVGYHKRYKNSQRSRK